MTVTNAELIQSVTALKEQRAKVKAQHKVALERETEPWKADVGLLILKARNERGLSINRIGEIIGVQNRTFIYDCIRAAQAQTDPNATVKGEVEVTQDIDPNAYEIEWLDDSESVRVVFDGGDEEYYLTVERKGKYVMVDSPEEWADHTRERRAVYKQILADVREHYA